MYNVPADELLFASNKKLQKKLSKAEQNKKR
jgi:hypothetical protein